MYDIPETVWAEAKEAWEDAWSERWREDNKEPQPALYIARAIMAERLRCAEIANKWALAEQDDEQLGSEEWLVRVAVNSCAQNIVNYILGES